MTDTDPLVRLIGDLHRLRGELQAERAARLTDVVDLQNQIDTQARTHQADMATVTAELAGLRRLYNDLAVSLAQHRETVG